MLPPNWTTAFRNSRYLPERSSKVPSIIWFSSSRIMWVFSPSGKLAFVSASSAINRSSWFSGQPLFEYLSSYAFEAMLPSAMWSKTNLKQHIHPKVITQEILFYSFVYNDNNPVILDVIRYSYQQVSRELKRQFNNSVAMLEQRCNDLKTMSQQCCNAVLR